MSADRTSDVEHLRRTVRDAPSASSAAVRRTMVGNRRRDSAAERRLRSALHAAGLRYRVDLPIRVPGARPIRPDIVFTRAKVAVFVDGCFWHACPEHGRPPQTNSTYWNAKIALNQSRDREQTAALEAAGWIVVRVWEHEAPDAAVRVVQRILAAQAASDSGSGAASTDRSDDATA
jgi:DNA mismatch endonuclease (patch repair protein)